MTSNPFIPDTLDPTDFAIFNNVDGGVIILKKDRRSTISYVNKAFAAYLNTTPALLINRSLGAISINQKPHSVAAEKFANGQPKLVRAMRGGRSVDAIIQEGKQKGRAVALTVWRMENHRDFMVGYARRSTRLEQVIESVTLNPLCDKGWKPLARFFLSGTRRPFFTSALTLLLSYVVATHPDWLPLLRLFLPDL